MSKAITPSQLKTEMNGNKDYLLQQCLVALNQISNKKLEGDFSSTCKLAAKIKELLATDQIK